MAASRAAENHARYYEQIHDALELALCITRTPSRAAERHDKPEVEVGPSSPSYHEELLLPPVLLECSGAAEKCLVESSVNSARVSFVFQKSDTLAALVVRKHADFMGQQAPRFHILRRRPIPGYDLSFLITHKEVAALGREYIIGFLLGVIRGIDADVAALKMMVNERARASAMEFFRAAAPATS